MPFRTIDKLILPEAASDIQHTSFIAKASPFGVQDARDVIIYVYTGQMNVEHGAGQRETTLTVGFPLLGFFGPINGPGAIGIIDIGDPKRFAGAVVSVGLSFVEPKGATAVTGIDFMNADLRPVVLQPLDTRINAAVLQVTLDAKEAVVTWVTYQATVMLFEPFLPENRILIGSANWNGKYTDVGNILLTGVPQP